MASDINKVKKNTVERLEDIISDSESLYKAALNTYFKVNAVDSIFDDYFEPKSITKAFSELLQVIMDLSNKDSYYRQYTATLLNTQNWNTVGKLQGIAENLLRDYEKNYLFNIEETIDEYIFTDILEQAKYLLSNKLVRASAIIAGVALESHLRKLATKNNIPTIKDDGRYVKAEKLNEDLKGADVYDPTYLKFVTAWLDLRNKAAHPNDPEIDKKGDLVEAVISGIGTFILKFPA